jgi:hypothetical protein
LVFQPLTRISARRLQYGDILLVEVVMAEAKLFKDNDVGYLAWIGKHKRGYVVNIARSAKSNFRLLHAAGCSSISPPRQANWTKQYLKLCADEIQALESWIGKNVEGKGDLDRCGLCKPRKQRA